MARKPRVGRVRTGGASLSGFEELKGQLRELPRATQRNVLKRAGTAAMNPVEQAAKSGAPWADQSGAARGSIVLVAGLDSAANRAAQRASFKKTGKGTKRARGSGGNLTVMVKGGGPAAPHFHFLELGTVKMAARPTLRPAFDNHAEAMIGRLKQELGPEIDKAVKRRARKAARG